MQLKAAKPIPWTRGDKLFAEMALVAVLGAIWLSLSILDGMVGIQDVSNDYRVFYNAAQKIWSSPLIYTPPPLYQFLNNLPVSYGPYLYAPFYLLPIQMMHGVPVFLAEILWLGTHLLILGMVLMMPAFRAFAADLGPRVSADRMVQMCFLMLLPLMLFDQQVGHPTLSGCALLLLGAIWLKPRPAAAGFVWACLTYKFQVMVLVPFVLMFWGEKTQRTRAIYGFVGGLAFVFLLGLAILGWQGWMDFARSVFGHASIVRHAYRNLGGNMLASPYIMLRWQNMDESIALAVQGITAIAAIWGTILAACRRNAAAVFLMLAAGFPLVTPYVYIYDLAPVAVATALLGARFAAEIPRWHQRLVMVALASMPFVMIALNGRTMPPAVFPILTWIVAYLWVRRLPPHEANPS